MNTLSELKANLKRRYRNGPDNIGQDFVAACLRHSTLYRRGTGFFSSSALAAYAESIDRMLDEGLRVEIICSPVIKDEALVRTLERNQTEEQRKQTVQRLGTKIVLDAVGYRLDSTRRDYRNHLLAYLIAKNILQIKIAIPKDFRNPNIESTDELSSNLYHVKTGYFRLSDGDVIAFDGSFNESNSGHTYHIENTQVLKSWDPSDLPRLQELLEDVDQDWEGVNPYIMTLDIEKETLEIIKSLAPKVRPSKLTNGNPLENPQTPNQTEKSTELRPYQLEALNAWKSASYKGILQMATGTGKTKTAIHAIKGFQRATKNGLVVVTVPKQQLALQWHDELQEAGLAVVLVYDDVNKWTSRVENISELHRATDGEAVVLPVLVCVNKTFNASFQNHLQYLEQSPNQRMLIVDECHHFNGSQQINKLPTKFHFRLGLSATPYEEDDPRLLEKYFGDVVFEYSVGNAIKDKWLCRYNYHPILIELTDQEAQGYIKTMRDIDRGAEGDRRRAAEDEADRILDGLVNKHLALEQSLLQDGVTTKTLFYCGEGFVELPSGEKLRQIHATVRVLHGLKWRVSTVTSQDNSPSERAIKLADFERERIDAIASMRILDEGIDIPDCRRAYILAGQRSERQAIQRRGRILRRAPNKDKADLYDFIIVGPKLTDQELVKLYVRELRRASLFAKDADNSDECLRALSQI
jgi:superfamily II DNA or RNA helicase